MNCRFSIADCRLKGPLIRRLFTSSFIVLTLSFILGCAPYAQVQIDLLDHSRKGIAHAKAATTSFAASVDQLHELRHQQLDSAFDADVREQPAIDADWVIDHRRAYAAALDVMAQQQASDRQAADSAQRNLDAIDQALQQIRYLQSVPLSWFGSNK